MCWRSAFKQMEYFGLKEYMDIIKPRKSEMAYGVFHIQENKRFILCYSVPVIFLLALSG